MLSNITVQIVGRYFEPFTSNDWTTALTKADNPPIIKNNNIYGMLIRKYYALSKDIRTNTTCIHNSYNLIQRFCNVRDNSGLKHMIDFQWPATMNVREFGLFNAKQCAIMLQIWSAYIDCVYQTLEYEGYDFYIFDCVIPKLMKQVVDINKDDVYLEILIENK